MPVVRAEVSASPIDAEALRAAVAGPDAGAVVCFVGQVRDHDPEASGTVTGLEYTAHPDAGTILAEVVAQVAHAGVRVAAVHRIGPLAVGEAALVVCVASAHRGEAFARCGEVVERIKAEVPLWKRQHTASGAAWSNLGLDG